MLIVLIGMPASGKSTTGKFLAKQCNYHFIDLDAFICEREKLSIQDIFAQNGEDYFRKIERETLKSCLSLQKTVLATGGGTPCFFDNMQLINKNGLSIFLESPLELLAGRIAGKKNNPRPLFSGKTQSEVLEILETIYRKREPFYRQAKLLISTKK